jgi:hypothetical protein
MKESSWGYLIIGLGIFIIFILFMVQNLTNLNEQDYYLSREILKSSMYDAIDYGTYMKSGKLVMSKEKFVSVFTRRFAESVSPDRTYKLDFYDIYEYPPKATIRISTNTDETVINNSGTIIEVNTFLTGILETSENGGEFSVVFNNSEYDMDGDGNFTSFDLEAILNYINHNSNCGDKPALDVNNDSRCDNKDYVLLRRMLYNGTPLDVDRNGVFDSNDVDLVSSCISNHNCDDDRVLNATQRLIADVNGDGVINNADLTELKKALAN